MTRANGVNVENTSVRKATPDVHMGMSTFNDYSPNSPYGRHDSTQRRLHELSRRIQLRHSNSGPSNSSSVKHQEETDPATPV